MKDARLRRDAALIVALLLLSGLLFILLHGKESGAGVVVRVGGEEIARYSLSQSGSYPLNGGTNLLVIEGGEAYIADAECPDRLCVRQGKVSLTGECITCLPNKLTVTVFGTEDSGIDAEVG
ncbi:MAG: NusG domain II-containing protein [Oscillospiraceae bacterium]|nr:NusG domain II-containing protein [Oscillospiraceae bacterium]